jgi:hypothetical protein
MQATIHPRAQQNAFRRRDVHQQSRSFARWNQSLRMIGDSHFRILGLIIDDRIFHQCNCWSQIARKFAIHESPLPYSPVRSSLLAQ